MWLALVIICVLLIWAVTRFGRSRRPLTNTPDFRNDSQRQHAALPMQTWAAFVKETYRKQKNSGAAVKLGTGFEIGIVGESFHLPELQWIREQGCGGDSSVRRVRCLAYLIPEPENPHSANGNAVRVESVRGGTIGHLSTEHADAYAPVFKALHGAQRVGVCRAVAVGGTGRKPNIGVWITIGHSAWLGELLTEAQ
jgi:hypothetical protein